jgi:OmpA-OmpF porin, OOP family
VPQRFVCGPEIEIASIPGQRAPEWALYHSSLHTGIAMKKAMVGIAVSLLACASHASPYVSVSAGSSTVDACGASAGCDDGSSGFKLLGGYKLNPNVAVEGGYFDFGKASSGGATLKANGFGAGGAFHYDVNSDFGVVGRLGVARMKADDSFSSSSASSTQLYGGLGLGYKVAPAWSVDAAYDFSKVEVSNTKFNVHMFSVGVTFAF